MQPRIITQVWQGLSVLSDAQELLDRDPEAANEHINHAKRHIIQALNWMREVDRETFFQSMTLDCTLGEPNPYTPREPFEVTLVEPNGNPVIALEIVTQDGVSLLWSFDRPVPQAEWFLQMGLWGAQLGLGIQFTLPEEPEG